MESMKRKASSKGRGRQQKVARSDESVERDVKMSKDTRDPEIRKPASRRKTRSSKGGPAVEAVFNTAELLENILIHLHFYDLLASQQVNMFWRDTVTNSTLLKEKLFLTPKPIQTRWAIVGSSMQSIHFTKVTPTTILPSPIDIEHPWWLTGPLTTPQLVLPVRLHPLLEVNGRPRGHISATSRDPAALDAFFNQHATVSFAKDLRRDSDAPWRNMYLSNPPCTELSATITFEVSEIPQHSVTVCFEMEEPKGITFGLLIDRAVDVEINSKNGKKCGKGHGTARKYLEDLEALHRRPAYVKSLKLARFDTRVDLRGVVAPSERKWNAVEAAAKDKGGLEVRE